MPPKKKKGKVTIVKDGPARPANPNFVLDPYAGRSADLNADWLKHLDDGRYQEEDLAAHDAVYPPQDREEDDEEDEEDDEDDEDE